MEIPIIQIGDSIGIKLDKFLMDRYQFSNNVEVVLRNEGILIKPVTTPRKDWDLAFSEMNKNDDDILLIDSFFSDESLVD